MKETELWLLCHLERKKPNLALKLHLSNKIFGYFDICKFHPHCRPSWLLRWAGCPYYTSIRILKNLHLQEIVDGSFAMGHTHVILRYCDWDTFFDFDAQAVDFVIKPCSRDLSPRFIYHNSRAFTMSLAVLGNFSKVVVLISQNYQGFPA